MTLPERVEAVKRKIAAAALEVGREAAEVTLVAATKVQTSDTIRQAIAAGITVCGENRVQEMTAHLDDDAYAGAALHFIGHLQTNKVKYVVGRVDMIESIDSRRLLEAVEARAAHLDLVQDILLEINVGGEASKSGAAPGEALNLARLAVQMPHIRLRGLMAIPPAARAPGENRHFFAEMYRLYVDIRTALDHNVTDMDCLSMGMSGDYEDAVREGATHVRVGTALFGPRPPMAKQNQG